MAFRKIGVAALFTALAMMVSVPAFAGTKLAYKQKFETVTLNGGSCSWRALGNVSMNVPGPGYVVVTAAGMAFFESDAFLTVSLGAGTSYRSGDWLFTLSPGPGPNLNYQTFSARMVFPVSAAGPRTFYFRGRSCSPSQPGAIGVQTGSITAEFYARPTTQSKAVQESIAVPPAPEEQAEQAAPEIGGKRAISDLPINK